MTKEEFLELFSEVDKHGYRYNPLNEYNFCILYRVNTKEFFIQYNKEFENYDGYTTEIAQGELKINFKIALNIYKLDSSGGTKEIEWIVVKNELDIVPVDWSRDYSRDILEGLVLGRKLSDEEYKDFLEGKTKLVKR